MENVKLGDIVDIRKGKKVTELEDGRYNYISIENLHLKSYTTYTDDEGVKAYEDDVLIAWDGANAGLVGTALKGMLGSTLAKLTIKDSYKTKLSSSFLYRFLDANFEYIKSRRTGATIPHVNGSDLRNMQIPLPSLSVQKSIASQLDKAQELIQYNQQLLEKYDELQQSLFLEMFGDPVVNEKGWEVKKVENIADSKKHSIKAGPFGSSLKKEFYVEKGYKIYGQEQVIKDDLTYGDYYINEEKYKELESCKVNTGDVLISLVGTYGKVALIPEKFEAGIINPRLMKISPNLNLIRPDFLKWILQSDYVKIQMKSYSRGGTMDIINVGIVKKLKIILPPLSLQNEFATRIELIEFQKELVKEALVKSEEIFNGLLQERFG